MGAALRRASLVAAGPGAPRREVRSFKPVTFWAPTPTLAAQAGDGGAGARRILGARVPRRRRAGGSGLRANGVGERSAGAAAARALPSR